MTDVLELMLAGKVDPDNLGSLRFPLYVSVKLDGIRAYVRGGRVYSRNHKEIPNRYIQQIYGRPEFEGMDGELICGPANQKDVFRITGSAVMSDEDIAGSRVQFHIFDCLTVKEMPFTARLAFVELKVSKLKKKFVSGMYLAVPHVVVKTVGELLQEEERALDAGFEGLMVRSLDGPYKHGRSTGREGYLLKLKRFKDCEAKIVGFDEQERNDNDKDASGKRTSHKAGKVGKDTLGALKVIGVNGEFKGVRFDVGTGFTDRERIQIWMQREKMVDSIIKVKYFPSGSKDKPRFPTFEGFRDPKDM